jgi:hypothetical protein
MRKRQRKKNFNRDYKKLMDALIRCDPSQMIILVK